MADIKEITAELYDDINNHDLDCFASHFAADFVEHEDVPGDVGVGAEGVVAWFRSLMEAFPDVRMDPYEILVADDRTVSRVRMHGTHTGTAFAGIPAQGKPFDFDLIDITRFAEDKVAEHWGVSDALKLMQQLGAVPPPPA